MWLIHLLLRPLLRLLLFVTVATAAGGGSSVPSLDQDPIPNIAMFSSEHQEEVRNPNNSEEEHAGVSSPMASDILPPLLLIQNKKLFPLQMLCSAF